MEFGNYEVFFNDETSSFNITMNEGPDDQGTEGSSEETPEADAPVAETKAAEPEKPKEPEKGKTRTESKGRGKAADPTPEPRTKEPEKGRGRGDKVDKAPEPKEREKEADRAPRERDDRRDDRGRGRDEDRPRRGSGRDRDDDRRDEPRERERSRRDEEDDRKKDSDRDDRGDREERGRGRDRDEPRGSRERGDRSDDRRSSRDDDRDDSKHADEGSDSGDDSGESEGGEWYSTGYKEADGISDREAAGGDNQTQRHWLREGEETTGTILDSGKADLQKWGRKACAPFCIWEHSFATVDSEGDLTFHNETCVNGRKDKDGKPLRCWFCVNKAKIKRRYTAMYTIATKWEGKRGERWTRKLLPANKRLMKILRRQENREGGLAGSIWDIFRTEAGAARVGDDWHVQDGKPYTEEELTELLGEGADISPIDYFEECRPKSYAELEQLYGKAKFSDPSQRKGKGRRRRSRDDDDRGRDDRDDRGRDDDRRGGRDDDRRDERSDDRRPSRDRDDRDDRGRGRDRDEPRGGRDRDDDRKDDEPRESRRGGKPAGKDGADIPF